MNAQGELHHYEEDELLPRHNPYYAQPRVQIFKYEFTPKKKHTGLCKGDSIEVKKFTDSDIVDIKDYYFGYINKLGAYIVKLHKAYYEQLTELLNLSFLQRFNYPTKMIKLGAGEKETVVSHLYEVERVCSNREEKDIIKYTCNQISDCEDYVFTIYNHPYWE